MKSVLYPGSFDPFTNGHLDLVMRASQLFDRVVVAVGINSAKNPMFSVEERKKLIAESCRALRGVEVASFEGLLVDSLEAFDVQAILRGLRAFSDFEYELQMAHMNARLFKDKVETIFLMTQPEYSFISSSMMKEVRSLGGNVEGLVPDKILKCMDKKLKV